MTAENPAGDGPLLVHDEGAVRTLTLYRPNAFNAFDSTLKPVLLAAVREAASDPAVRAVVITGSGRAFCAGQDLKEHLQLVKSGDPRLADTVSGFFNPLVRQLAAMGKPVIAAINGAAAGAGTGLAAACDLRIAARSAVFRTSFAGVALSADTGLSFSLPRLVGTGRAMRMLLLDEPVGAEEALAIGLVDYLVDDAELPAAASTLAAKLAAGPTAAYGWIARSVRTAATASLDDTLDFEGRAQAACFSGADHLEAIDAFVAKRAPRFTGV
jgi:2-(1,2-epoxy-1,2-dihydrophenyl)acetyl-CoA isomerase